MFPDPSDNSRFCHCNSKEILVVDLSWFLGKPERDHFKVYYKILEFHSHKTSWWIAYLLTFISIFWKTHPEISSESSVLRIIPYYRFTNTTVVRRYYDGNLQENSTIFSNFQFPGPQLDQFLQNSFIKFYVRPRNSWNLIFQLKIFWRSD